MLGLGSREQPSGQASEPETGPGAHKLHGRSVRAARTVDLQPGPSRSRTGDGTGAALGGPAQKGGQHMSANIFGARFLGRREPAWHGLGGTLDAALRALVARAAGGPR